MQGYELGAGLTILFNGGWAVLDILHASLEEDLRENSTAKRFFNGIFLIMVLE